LASQSLLDKGLPILTDTAEMFDILAQEAHTRDANTDCFP
jgi:hypothetical protein